MRILADENVAGEIVEALRRQGHDVAWVLSDASGIPDAKVLRRAGEEGRLVLTFDKDFGELAFRAGIPATPGVILLRLMASDPSLLAARVASALHSRDDWEGHFSVVEADRVRMTPLP
jgi:predicted nuclease of predicted toxin-antitoxin system